MDSRWTFNRYRFCQVFSCVLSKKLLAVAGYLVMSYIIYSITHTAWMKMQEIGLQSYLFHFIFYQLFLIIIMRLCSFSLHRFLIFLIPCLASLATATSSDYTILSETKAYSRYRTILQRKVQFPLSNANSNETHRIPGKVVDFDIVDQSGLGAVIILAYNSQTKTVRLLREYNPGCHKVLYGPAAGLVEAKHSQDHVSCLKEGIEDEEKNWRKAAEWELEEECHLEGGTWYELGEKTSMDKYVVTKIKPFLVVDATHVENPKPLDFEEEIDIVDGITIEQVWEIIRNGEMNLVGGWASMLAIRKLEELGLL